MTKGFGPFPVGSPEAAAAGRKGGSVTAAERRARQKAKTPYAHPFISFLGDVGRGGPTRAVWRVFWKCADGLALEPDEVEVFRLHTGRTTPPTAPARECWLPAGRRGGKSENMTARGAWRGISQDWSALLSPGGGGVLPLIAADRDQARNTLAYLKGLARHPKVRP